MKTNLDFSVALIATIAFLTGCQVAPMTAKSHLTVDGQLTVVQRTTTVFIAPDGKTSTNVVEVATSKSPSAGDLELKGHELNARRDVGVARASFWNWFWTPTPVQEGYYGGGYYGSSGNCFGPSGGAYGGTLNWCPAHH